MYEYFPCLNYYFISLLYGQPQVDLFEFLYVCKID